MTTFETETGSRYTIDHDNFKIIREEATHELRKDDEWRPLIAILHLREGDSARLIIDIRGDGIETVRTTSRVTRIHYNV